MAPPPAGAAVRLRPAPGAGTAAGTGSAAFAVVADPEAPPPPFAAWLVRRAVERALDAGEVLLAAVPVLVVAVLALAAAAPLRFAVVPGRSAAVPPRFATTLVSAAGRWRVRFVVGPVLVAADAVVDGVGSAVVVEEPSGAGSRVLGDPAGASGTEGSSVPRIGAPLGVTIVEVGRVGASAAVGTGAQVSAEPKERPRLAHARMARRAARIATATSRTIRTERQRTGRA
jgi:hypothetical protein